MNQHCNPRLHKPVSRLYVALISLMIIAGLSACGGGGGGSRPSLSIDSPLVVEGNTGTAELQFTITLSESAEETLTLSYATADGTATLADNDYTAASGQITIAVGSQVANVSVFINGDDDFEQEETINLNISNPQGIRLAESSISGVGAIENDDDADPNGYFAGSATIDNNNLTDVRGLSYSPDNQVIIISPTINVLYDITYTNITLTTFTGTVDVYVNGTLEQDGQVTVSGTTDESILQGTFAGGTGQATGAFSLTFDPDNNRAASLARIETFIGKQWTGDFNSVDVVPGILGFDSAGVYGGGNNILPACIFTSGITQIPPELVNIFQLSNDVGQSVGCNYVGTNHTGYGAVIDIAGTDDGMVYAVTNGVNAVFAVFSRIP